MFDAYPAYGRYRALKLAKSPEPLLTGEDVYALQTMLAFLGQSVGPFDGVFGPQTDKAVRAAQKALGVAGDGAVGPVTWAQGVTKVARYFRDYLDIAIGLLYGQLAHESGLRGGNYSPLRDDGTYDAGVAQRNTKHTPAREGFDVPASIQALAQNTRQHYALFSGVAPHRRRWTLAAGAWNAPAFACYYAKQEGASGVQASQTLKPSPSAAKLFAEYMMSVTAYLKA